ncbi:MAG: ATP-binding protein [Treponema sp.]|nr:ATP-binding protein [Treponema sp.]
MPQHFLERAVTNELLRWKNKANRQPLLISGARQVGKTHSVLSFGKEHYKTTAYFNMEDSRDIQAVFERDLDPVRIVRELSALSGTLILKGDTLIIFDEAQACERALSSLKYFAEHASGYHVIATGSLLGISLNRKAYSFPVGKVDMLTMHPLSFEEFLWATGNRELSALILESYATFAPLSPHNKALELYKTYLVVGGMPHAVAEYAQSGDFDFVTAIQKSLNDAYIADMAKYATPQETTRIMAAWASVPAQLAKDNHKFQYRVVKSGARAYEYETSLQWLSQAGIITRCVRVREASFPLTASIEPETFKVYMMDTGLLCSKFSVNAAVVLNEDPRLDRFKGALAENYVCQALTINGIVPCYWESAGKAELDFLFQDTLGNVIPLEVKAADNVRAKSLLYFVEKYHPPYSIRVSARNFGFENQIQSVPLYAVYCIRA